MGNTLRTNQRKGNRPADNETPVVGKKIFGANVGSKRNEINWAYILYCAFIVAIFLQNKTIILWNEPFDQTIVWLLAWNTSGTFSKETQDAKIELRHETLRLTNVHPKR